MKDKAIWSLARGEGPLVATALHDGHAVRPEIRAWLALSHDERRREEDPYTGAWTGVVLNRVVGRRSRFEVDLNRAREQAVYRTPDDAWGMTVWKGVLPAGLVERSLAEYDAFYAEMRGFLKEIQDRYGHFVVYDLHSYNHRRGGPEAPPADPASNPEVNIGTGTMDREYWAPVVDRFIRDLRGFDFLGRTLDVRENVKFMGRGFPRFVHENFPGTGCALAIEFKKFFMDEWTGALHLEQHLAITDALGSTVPGMVKELEDINRRRRHDTATGTPAGDGA